MKAIVASLLLLISSNACGETRSPAHREDPYGLWSTEKGDVLIVRRNGSYTFCAQIGCENGRWTKDGETHVVLEGFAEMKATESIRLLSHWQEISDAEFQAGDSFKDRAREVSFGDMEPIDPLRHRICGDQACFVIGASDQGEIYRFLKLERY